MHHSHNHTNVTTTPSTAHHKQTTTHPLQTTINQRKKHRHTLNQHKQHQKQNLVHSTQPDIITIQETKLTQKAKTPKYTTIHTDREHKQGGWLITLIKDDITFTNINIHNAINTHNTELQLIKIHIGKTKDITVANTYFPPRDSTSPHYNTVDTDIAYCIRHVTNIPDSILTGDVNEHSQLRTHYTKHRHTHQSAATSLQQATSPDITTIYTTAQPGTQYTH